MPGVVAAKTGRADARRFSLTLALFGAFVMRQLKVRVLGPLVFRPSSRVRCLVSVRLSGPASANGPVEATLTTSERSCRCPSAVSARTFTTFFP